jgi:hypothetical protein
MSDEKKCPDHGIERYSGCDFCDENMYPCIECKGSGFSGYGTGYGDVCSRCGGMQYEAPEGFVSNRPETGVMVFGDDWPGVFIRGDDAFMYAEHMRRVIRAVDGTVPKAVLDSLQELLRSCQAPVTGAVQRLRSFNECKIPHVKKDSVEAHCHAARDGECFWKHCPQIRDGEPRNSGRHCPYDQNDDDDL